MPGKYHLCFFFLWTKITKPELSIKPYLRGGSVAFHLSAALGLSLGKETCTPEHDSFNLFWMDSLGGGYCCFSPLTAKGAEGTQLRQRHPHWKNVHSENNLCDSLSSNNSLNFLFLPTALCKKDHPAQRLLSLGWRVKPSIYQGKQAKSFTGQKEH